MRVRRQAHTSISVRGLRQIVLGKHSASLPAAQPAVQEALLLKPLLLPCWQHPCINGGERMHEKSGYTLFTSKKETRRTCNRNSRKQTGVYQLGMRTYLTHSSRSLLSCFRQASTRDFPDLGGRRMDSSAAACIRFTVTSSSRSSPCAHRDDIFSAPFLIKYCVLQVPVQHTVFSFFPAPSVLALNQLRSDPGQTTPPLHPPPLQFLDKMGSRVGFSGPPR